MRLAIVLALVAVVVLATLAARTRRRRLAEPADVTGSPRLPERFHGRPTWIVFSTEYCATCGPVTERLRSAFPADHVERIDVAADPALAVAFDVRAAPTIVRADARGIVLGRWNSAAALDEAVFQPI